MATIQQLITRTEDNIRDNKDREADLRATIDGMITRAERAGRTEMSDSEQVKSEALLKDIETLKVSRKRMNAQLADMRRVQAEDDEIDRKSQIVIPNPTKRASITAEYRTDGKAIRTADVPEWSYRDTGESAIVSRDMRFADHAIVRAESARNAERDRIVMGTHGSLVNQLRAMTTSGASAIVPVDWSANIIDKARNASVMFEAGCQLVPMAAKTVQIARLTADPTVSFKTEGSPVGASDMSYDYIQLVATSMTALVVVSMEFMQDAVSADAQITSALGAAMGLELDKAILFGQLGATGTNDEGAAYGLASPYPKGILKSLVDYNSGSQIVGAFPANGTPQTAATPWTEMLGVVYKPLRANEKCNAIVSNVALVQQYDGMMDTQYNPIRKPEAIASRPWLTTNAIPSYTRGTLANRATDVFAGDFSQVLVGQRLGMEIRVLTERYAENGQVGLLAYWRGDVAIARPGALAAYRGLQGAL